MPADVTMELDTRQASAFVRAVWADQLPFATSKAINDSALGGQKVQRAHQREIFTVRRASFVDRAVKIAQFAKKDALEARVRVEPPGGQKRADVIAKFEDMTIKGPFRGTSIAVPTRHVPRTGAGIIKKAWRPKSLLGGGKAGSSDRLLPGGGVLVGNETMQGKKHVFLIRRSSGKGTIFMRINPRNAAKYKAAGEDGVRRNLRDANLVPLYQLVPRVSIEPELHFVDNIRRHVLDNWDANFNRAFTAAMQTAR